MAPPTPDDVLLLEMMIRGRVVIPENTKEYQAQIERTHNAGFHHRKPVLFVLCHDAADVKEVLKFVTKHELPLSIRSGGHSACGSSLRDGTVVIDLGRMRDIEYDASTELVTLQPGCTLSDINVYLMRQDRMVPVGVAPPTGAGGLCLHGGIGHLSHRFGLAVDNITEIEILLADGSVKTVNYDSTGDDKEIFFAARGAAGSIGIVSRFTMRTYPMEMITGGVWLMRDDRNYTETRKLMRKARDMILEQDKVDKRRLTGLIYAGNAPPEPLIPAELHGVPCTIVFAGAWGTDEAAMDMIKVFCPREVIFGKPPAPMPFNVFNQLLSGLFLNFGPLANYYKGEMVSEFPEDKLDAFMDIWSKHEASFDASFVGMDFYGGKGCAEHGNKLTEENDHCVSSLRTFNFSIPALIYFPDAPGMFEKSKALSREMVGILSELSTTAYSNFHTDFGDEVEQEHSAKSMLSDQERLKAIKAKVDPKNIFNRLVIKT